jgi:hypothetical protein
MKKKTTRLNILFTKSLIITAKQPLADDRPYRRERNPSAALDAVNSIVRLNPRLKVAAPAICARKMAAPRRQKIPIRKFRPAHGARARLAGGREGERAAGGFR